MTSQMKETLDATWDIEMSKMETQMKFHNEQMAYQRNHDIRLQENACQTNLNAKLSIEKQAEVVHCLAQLASVLSANFHIRQALTMTTLPNYDLTPDAGPITVDEPQPPPELQLSSKRMDDQGL